MRCENCGHEQESGKFCGKCGNALVVSTAPTQEPDYQQASTAGTIPQAAASAYQPTNDPHVHVEKVKETSKMYWNYFLESLYTPSKVLGETDKNFGNALITFALFALITSLGINNIIGTLFEFLGGFGEMPTFIQVFLRTATVVAILFALSLGSLFIVSKFFGPQTSFKTLIAMVGTYLVPMSVLVFATYVLLIIGSIGIGTSLFFFSLFLSVYVMPLFLVTTLINQKSQQTDKFYAFGAYVAIFSVGLFIVSSIYTESTIIPLFQGLIEFFEYLSYGGSMFGI